MGGGPDGTCFAEFMGLVSDAASAEVASRGYDRKKGRAASPCRSR